MADKPMVELDAVLDRYLGDGRAWLDPPEGLPADADDSGREAPKSTRSDAWSSNGSRGARQ